MKNAAILITFFLITFTPILKSQSGSSKYTLDFTRLEERRQFKEEMLQNKIIHNLGYPLTGKHEEKWMEAFWAAEFSLHRSQILRNAIRTALTHFDKRSLSFQRALLEVIYSLYPETFLKELAALVPALEHPKLYAMAVSCLTKNMSNGIQHFIEHMHSTFPEWEKDPILKMLDLELRMRLTPELFTVPPLTDLLSYPIEKHKTIIFSLQRKNREYPGLIVIRKPDGTFLRNEDGSFFTVSQLAKAITRMPGYLTNGNTPEGIFSLQEIYKSEVDFIGPTPSLKIIMPFEDEPSVFFHNRYIRNIHFTEKVYAGLLPESWRNYLPIFEAYYAGKAGRYDIVMHGTTIDPSFYEGESYYPNTPSLGCLCAYEEWCTETGMRLESNQQQLIDAYLSTGSRKGYAVIVNIDDKEEPVTIDDIQHLLLEAEKR